MPPDSERRPSLGTGAPVDRVDDILRIPTGTDSRRRRRAVFREDRQGWKAPRKPHEAPHPTFIEPDHYRVVCRECGWYWARLGVTAYDLREMGKRHRANMREGAA